MTVIVGTDGTEPGTAAVEWAAAEAQRRRMPLRIVHAYDWDWHESRFDAAASPACDWGRSASGWSPTHPARSWSCSTVRQVLHHADCPILITHQHPEGQP